MSGALHHIPESESAEAINERGDIAGMALGGGLFASIPVIWRHQGSGQFDVETLRCHYQMRDCLPVALNNRAEPDVVGNVRGRALPWYDWA